MFSDLPIDPESIFGTNDPFSFSTSDIPDDGAEVLLVFAEEAYALYINGERVWNNGRLHRGALMNKIANHTDGKLAAYREAAAVYNKRTGECLYNKSLPEDPSDIIFSNQLTTITIREADDLQKLDSDEARNAEYLQVRVKDGGISEDLIQSFVGEDVDIFKLIT